MQQARRLKWLHIYAHMCVFEVAASKGEQLSWERILGDAALGLLVHVEIFTVPFSKTRVSKSRAREPLYSPAVYLLYDLLCRANVGEKMEGYGQRTGCSKSRFVFSTGIEPRKMDCYSGPRELKLSRG